MSPRDVTNIPGRLAAEQRRTIIQSHPDIIDIRAWLAGWSFRERCLLILIALFAFAITVILGGSKGEAHSLDIYQRQEAATDL